MQLVLNRIAYNVCPECASPACEASIEADQYSTQKPTPLRTHVHGGTWQRVKFACGRVDTRHPFGDIKMEHPCKHNEQLKIAIIKREAAKTKVIDAISALDVDDNFKARLLLDIQYKSTAF